MYQVSSEIWIGHAGDLRKPQRCYECQITTVVELTYEEQAAVLPRDFLRVRIPVMDGPGNSAAVVYLAILTVTGLIVRKAKSIVCCSAGMSRSPTIAAAAISLVT